MLRTPVPETAVHEYGNAMLGEKEINPDVGRARRPGAPLLACDPQFLLSSPTRDAVAAKKFGECKLRVLVATSPNPRHHFGALALPVAGTEAIPVSVDN